MMRILILSLLVGAEPGGGEPRFAENPVNALGIELLLERIQLAKVEAGFSASHPAIPIQRSRVRRLELTLKHLKEAGLSPDQEVIEAHLQVLLARAEAELETATDWFTAKHPRLGLLKQRVAVLKRIAGK